MQRKDRKTTKIQTLDFKTDFTLLETKEGPDAGTFSGYASIFGNVDSGGDVVERGAFREIDLTKDGMVRILNQHRMSEPIGKAKVTQDDKGLKVDGHLVLGIAAARNAYEAMKAGILDGMSIGYDVLEGGAEITNAGIRRLKAVKLWEVSLVTFGMNELARVEHVKERIAQIKTRRDFEDYLREGGFSANQAKAIASVGWKEAESQSREVSEEVKQTTERIAALGGDVKSVTEVIERIRTLNFS